MKVKALFLLLLFMSFTAAPTILSSLYNDIDVSYAYTLAEEEEVHDHSADKLKIIPKIIEIDFSLSDRFYVKIPTEFLLTHNNTLREVFSPPPENNLV
ncbi:MAG: hypothetical protein WCY89_01140 [Flavobacteriaceae bacterium]